jgi:hypothetical protein
MDTTTAPAESTTTSDGLDAAAAAIADLLDPKKPGQTAQVEDQDQAAEAADETGADEAQADAQADADPEAAEDDAEAPADTVTVEIDGKAVTLSRAEIAEGYLRQADYTKKTQALADMRRQAEEMSRAITAEQARLAQLLPAVQRILQDQAGAEPDWAKLEAEDPIGFASEWAKWQRHTQQQNAVRAERDRLAQAEEAKAIETIKAKLAEEREKLLKAVPELAKPEVFERERGEMRTYLEAAGATAEEINSLADHRLLLLVRKAMAYDRLQNARPKLAAAPGPAQRVTQVPTSGPRRAQRDAQTRFAKSGSLRDAASVIEHLI